MGLLSLFLLLNLSGPSSVEVPVYPQTALAGGTVVAELEVVSGRVKQVIIHSDDGAFDEVCNAALAKWRFDSAHDGRELVIVHFRHPALFSFGDADQELRSIDLPDSLPSPRSIRRPVYPVTVLARGGVVLRVEVNEQGAVSGVEVVKGLGGLTETSIQAVREWIFRPAKGPKGNPMPWHAYALFIYRFPVLSPPSG